MYNCIVLDYEMAIQYSTVQYNTVQYNTVQYSTIQYSTIQYNTVHVYYTTMSDAVLSIVLYTLK